MNVLERLHVLKEQQHDDKRVFATREEKHF
jgi:hypothetical protein